MPGQQQLEIVNQKLKQHFSDSEEYRFAVQERDVTSGWLWLADSKDIKKVAQTIAELQGRVMAITASETQAEGLDVVEIVYHFAVGALNCNCIVTLPDNARQIESITPILKSADWQEREMQELYNVQIQHHPNPKALFLEEGFSLANQSMVPLSEAMDGAMTTTLWERVMQAKKREVEKDE
jgi:NADH-quinone oxidoreductase subunit C